MNSSSNSLELESQRRTKEQNMNSSSNSLELESQRQEESLKLKRRLISAIEDNLNPHHQTTRSSTFYSTDIYIGAGSSAGPISLLSPTSKNLNFAAARGEDPLGVFTSMVPPPPPPAVTVVLEGRSICQRISLHKHASYQSLAKALRQMFVLDHISEAAEDHNLNLSNAIPGHLIAYEDMENDLLLVGDLSWKDFVRVAKRIRILPAKTNSRKGRGGGGIN